MRSLTKREWAFLTFVGMYSFVPAIFSLARIPEFFGGPAVIPANPRALLQPLPIILHILGSSVFLLGGAVQFLPSIRRKHPTAHKALGHLVAAAGCISALSGLCMTVYYTFPPALQGPLLLWSRVVLSLSMFALIVHAVMRARARNILAHRASMLRAYAIGQGASTQTALFIAAMVLFGAEPAGFARDVLMVTAWFTNLTIAEVLIRRPAIPRTRRQGGSHHDGQARQMEAER